MSDDAERRRLGEPAAERRILLVTDKSPGMDSGYGLRVANVIHGLSQVGRLHVCLIDSSIDGVELPQSDAYSGSKVRAEDPSRWRKLALGPFSVVSMPYVRSAGVRETVQAAVGSENWDLVWYSRARTYWIAQHIGGCPLIVDFDDLTDGLLMSTIRDRMHRNGRLANLPLNLMQVLQAFHWRRLQRSIVRDVDGVVVCSEADRRSLGCTKAHVAPNGYPVPARASRSVSLTSQSMLFVGPLTYEPNRLAIDWLAREVLPLVRVQRPDARLVVVGRHDHRAESLRSLDGVSLEGYVDDVSPYYATASVAVTPLHSGGGTRLKVIEALAYGVPLVTTSFGCFGLGLTDGHEALIADNPGQFSRACLSIMDDRALANRLVRVGLEEYRRRFTASACSDAVAALALTMTRDVARMTALHSRDRSEACPST